nr:unnamed protein product [Digitaria exilis]
MQSSRWARPSWKSIFEARNTLIWGGALDAAFTVLETGNVSGATPEAVGTACALARSPYILHDACNKHTDSCYHDWVYEKLCLDIFRKGKSTFLNIKDRDITHEMS